MELAYRNLLQEKLRFTLSVAGIALSLMIVLVLNGIATGVSAQTGAYLDRAPGAIVVTSAGTENFLLTTALLPAGTENAVKAVPGVAAVVPLLSRTVVVRLHDRREASYLIGYDPARGGGPWRLTAGRAPESGEEIVVDRLLARRHGLAVGNVIELLGRTFRVSGLSGETSTLMTSFVFVRKAALEALTLAPGATSFLLVTPEPGVAAATLRDRLSAVPSTCAFLKQELIANDVAIFAGLYQPPIRLMAGIAFVVGTLVVGLVIYAATTERRREYGVLKAIGVRNRLLYRLVATQALLAAVAGVAGGIVLGVVAARLIMAFRPEFLIALTPANVAVAVAAGLAMALIAALFPTRVIAGLAPADVFQR